MIGCIVQARMGSSRLPVKVMMKLDGKKNVLECVINQVKYSKKIDKIVIVTTTKNNDDVIVNISKENDCDYFRGSERDVLDRYFHCATKFLMERLFVSANFYKGNHNIQFTCVRYGNV